MIQIPKVITHNLSIYPFSYTHFTMHIFCYATTAQSPFQMVVKSNTVSLRHNHSPETLIIHTTQCIRNHFAFKILFSTKFYFQKFYFFLKILFFENFIKIYLIFILFYLNLINIFFFSKKFYFTMNSVHLVTQEKKRVKTDRKWAECTECTARGQPRRPGRAPTPAAPCRARACRPAACAPARPAMPLPAPCRAYARSRSARARCCRLRARALLPAPAHQRPAPSCHLRAPRTPRARPTHAPRAPHARPARAPARSPAPLLPSLSITTKTGQ